MKRNGYTIRLDAFDAVKVEPDPETLAGLKPWDLLATARQVVTLAEAGESLKPLVRASRARKAEVKVEDWYEQHAYHDEWGYTVTSDDAEAAAVFADALEAKVRRPRHNYGGTSWRSRAAGRHELSVDGYGIGD